MAHNYGFIGTCSWPSCRAPQTIDLENYNIIECPFDRKITDYISGYDKLTMI